MPTEKQRNDLLHFFGMIATLAGGYLLGVNSHDVAIGYLLCALGPGMIGYVRGQELRIVRHLLAWYDENYSKLVAHKIIKGENND